ncbi:MAG: ribonuclease III [Verrucomicrobia bacterium]|nr:ribonuclease III [Verrucomicrobiota bacterium]
MIRPYQKLLEQVNIIEERIDYTFKNKNILTLSFVHRSFFNENRSDTPEHNERLEFLGDSVLGLLIAEYLYGTFPEESEGQLSHLKATLVEAATCAKFVQKLGLAEFILLGKGERMQDGRSKESIQADLFEALLAAVYLDGGMEAAKHFFWSHFAEEIALHVQKPVRNWKAELQEVLQRTYQKLPLYKVLKEQGPDHNKIFEVGVFLEETLLGSGIGSSKKEAEQSAAKQALHAREEKKDG